MLLEDSRHRKKQASYENGAPEPSVSLVIEPGRPMGMGVDSLNLCRWRQL